MNIDNKYQKKLIDKEKWQGYKSNKDVFLDEIVLDKHNGDTQKKLWEFIVKNRSEIKDKIMKAIRIITEMCCKIDEEVQIKTLSYPLFKFVHLYDQNFYDFVEYDYEGLNKFLKILKSTFGNIENFNIKFTRVRAIILFVEEGRDKLLIEEYNYLKNIILPISGYESLRMDLLTILKKFNQLAPVITEQNNFEEFKEEISKFKKVYIIEYQKRHLFYQNRIEYLRRKIQTLPSYIVLRRLDNIEGIKKEDKIEYIESFFANKCNKNNINRILLQQPKCHCGFTIGENMSIPSLDKIKPMLREAIDGKIQILRKKLKSYCQQKPDSPLNKLYKINNIKNLAGIDLINIFNEEIINEINIAFGNKSTIKISIDELLSRFEVTYTADNINIMVDRFKELLIEKISKYTGSVDRKNVIIKIEK